MTAQHARNTLVVAVTVALATLAPATPAAAQRTTDADTTRVVDRLGPRDVEHVLVTRKGDVALLLAGESLYLQLTDQGLDEIEAADEMEEGEGLGARILAAMLRAGVRELLDHALAHPVAAIERAEYIDGRLVLEDREGESLFDITVEDRDVMTDFPEREARIFAREIRMRIRDED